jgi:hypothetical protein
MKLNCRFAPIAEPDQNLIFPSTPFSRSGHSPRCHGHERAKRVEWLPRPWTNITVDFDSITDAFQNRIYIGQLRENWKEIKKVTNYFAPELSISN